MGLRCTRFLGVVFLFVLPFLFAAFLSAQPAPVEPRITQAIDEHQLVTLKGNTHRLARPQFDRGEAPSGLPMDRMLLVLKRSAAQEHSLRTLLDNQHDKASANYHQWLTPEQFGKQFGPADQDMQVVAAWLQSHGFQVGNVAKGRSIIEFSGTAAQVKEAFHTSIHKFVVNGEEHWANSSDPQIPAALTPVVEGVHTLHNFLKKPMLQFSGEHISGKYVQGKPPQMTFSDGTHGLGPADYATIYNIPVTSGGSGRTIAIVGRSNLYSGGQDVYNFNNIFAQGNGVNIILNGPDPGDLGGGEEAEATLDSTWSGAVAPEATIDLVVSATTNDTDGVDLSELYIIDNNLGDVMSESFSGCEYYTTQTQEDSQESLAEQAAAQGITYMVSSGDSGAEGCDDPNNPPATGPLSINALGSTPFTVTVGGTMFNENGEDTKYWSSINKQPGFGSALSYIPENVWNESCTGSGCGLWAGGGGVSTFFTKPSWQSGVTGIPNDGARDVPDVSLTAAGHDPYLLCLEGSCVPNSQGEFFVYFISGTSASSPSFAGVMALVDAATDSRQGQAAYVLYKLAAKETYSKCNGSNTSGLPASTCTFNDVTVGNNVVPGEQGNQYSSGVGYDRATGLGSVNVTNLVNNWNSVTFNATTTTIVAPSSPVNVAHGQPVTFNVTVTSNSGTPTGSVSLVTSNNQSIGVFPITSFPVQVTSLPGSGNIPYTVIAQYGGDGTFGASISLPSPSITVAPENSASALTVDTLDQNFNFVTFNGGPYGSFVYLRADVTAQSGFGTATGTVNFLDGTSGIQGNPYSLNSKGNTATPNYFNSPLNGAPSGLFTLAPGPHAITANYSGDPSFNASTSTASNFTITQASTTNVVSFTGAPQGALLTATVGTKSGGNPPTGTVQFYVNGNAAGSPVGVVGTAAGLNFQTGVLIGAIGTSSYNDAGLANGSYTLSAKYSGDTNYVASSSTSVPIKIQADFGFTANTNVVNVSAPGATGALKLTVTAWDGFNGTISFASSSCVGLPAGASCIFTPSSITGNGTSQLAISTTATSASLLKPEIRHYSGWHFAALGTFFLGIVFIATPSRRRRAHMLMLIGVFSLLLIPGCGGGSSSGGSTPPPPPVPTPSGSYPMTVTATSGSLSHQVSFTLNVQ